MSTVIKDGTKKNKRKSLNKVSFEFNELLRIIGEKYGLEINDDSISKLSESESSTTQNFLEEAYRILSPLDSFMNGDNTKVGSWDEIRAEIPEEYYEKIHPIDNDGNRLLSLSELKEAMKLTRRDALEGNTNKAADSCREKLQSNYIHNEYPFYTGFEASWRLLAKDDPFPDDRKDHLGENPLFTFESYVDTGLYPPPEIMLSVGRIISMYKSNGGNFSLDELFFGEKHKKTRSLPYKRHKDMRYFFFEINHSRKHKNQGSKNHKPSLEEKAADFLSNSDPILLNNIGIDPSTDVETFLRGYRRWKRNKTEEQVSKRTKS